jgi:hypothetical protein
VDQAYYDFVVIRRVVAALFVLVVVAFIVWALLLYLFAE